MPPAVFNKKKSLKPWRMCYRKEWFGNHYLAELKAWKFDLRTYECPHCKGYHNTSKPKTWRSK